MTIELDPKPLTVQQVWNSPQLAVIVPSYKERDNVAPLYDKVTAALGDIPFEFIVVDDNSPDGTAAVVKDMARKHANVRCIHRIGRRGLSSAVIEGISASAAPYFAVIDADHQHDERILPQMLDKRWPATTSSSAPAMPAPGRWGRASAGPARRAAASPRSCRIWSPANRCRTR